MGRIIEYVGDGKAAFMLSGIRWVAKTDKHYMVAEKKQTFGLEVTYKGSSKEVYYSSQEERDAMYDLIMKHMRIDTV